MKFSEAQLEQYRTYGYVIVACPFPERLTEECMATVEKAAQDPTEGPADGSKRNHFSTCVRSWKTRTGAPSITPCRSCRSSCIPKSSSSAANWPGTAISICAMAVSMSRPRTDQWGGTSTGVRGGRSSCTISPGLRARTDVCALSPAVTPGRLASLEENGCQAQR